MDSVRSFYLPVYRLLEAASGRSPFPYQPQKARKPRQVKTDLSPAFTAELTFLRDRQQEQEVKKAFEEVQKQNDEAELAAGNGFECQCCFGDLAPRHLTTCAEGHQFCA